MTKEIEDFFKNMQQKNDKALFFFYQFYNHPDVSLGGNKEETLDNYYNYGNIKNLIKCDNFFEFLNLCFNDLTFLDKLDDVLLTKLSYIIVDIKEFKENYISDLEDKYFRDFFNNLVPVGKYNKYTNLELCSISNYYKRCGWFYELGLNKDCINMSDDLFYDLSYKIDFTLRLHHQKHIKPLQDEKIILKMIETDDYNQDNTYLTISSEFDRKTFKALVCNNKFLNICNNTLLNQTLSSVVIDNILRLLEMSINFKTLNIIYNNFYERYEELGKDRIKKFDLELARELIKKFKKKKKECKIIKLYKLEGD